MNNVNMMSMKLKRPIVSQPANFITRPRRFPAVSLNHNHIAFFDNFQAITNKPNISAMHPIKKRKVQRSHDNRYTDCWLYATCSKQIQSKINKGSCIWNQRGVFGLHKWKLTHLRKIDRNKKNLSSKRAWST